MHGFPVSYKKILLKNMNFLKAWILRKVLQKLLNTWIPSNILKKFLIHLIKKYIKDDIRYNLSQLYNSKTDIDLFIYLLPLYQETITKYYLLLNDNNRELIYKNIPDGELNDKLKQYYPDGYDRKTMLIYNIIELLKSK